MNALIVPVETEPDHLVMNTGCCLDVVKLYRDVNCVFINMSAVPFVNVPIPDNIGIDKVWTDTEPDIWVLLVAPNDEPIFTCEPEKYAILPEVPNLSPLTVKSPSIMVLFLSVPSPI